MKRTRGLRLLGWLLPLAIVVTGSAGCRSPNTETDRGAEAPTAVPGVDPSCDDTRPESNVPAEGRRELGLPGDADALYGDGDVWMLLSDVARWSDLVGPADGPGEFSGKFGMFVTVAAEPDIRATLDSDRSVVVAGSVSPTTAGLPGPTPAGVRFTSAGCWTVTVEGEVGVVTFKVDVH